MRFTFLVGFLILTVLLGLTGVTACYQPALQESSGISTNISTVASDNALQNKDTPKSNSQSDQNLAKNSESPVEFADNGSVTTEEGSTTKTQIGELTAKELSSMLASGEKLILIDLNPPAEYKEGHIRGAIWGDYGSIRTGGAETYLTQLGVKKTDTIVLVCESGNKSARAVPLVAKAGYLRVYNLKDGNIGWLRAGFNLEK
jgi:rhodanese-related sulfurtransferase